VEVAARRGNVYSSPMLKLGVNIDHVATLRQARYKTAVPSAGAHAGAIPEPDPVWAAIEVELAGAHGITMHLREDRRHIQDRDVRMARGLIRTRLNLEMADVPSIVAIAEEIKPDEACLVPEKRQEITTEGGLDVAGQAARIGHACETLGAGGIRVSLFIDPEPKQVEAAKRAGAPAIELHTGAYAGAQGAARAREFERLRSAARIAASLGLTVNAGHGLDYHNVEPVAAIPEIVELNIGHAIVARAVFDGLAKAVREMKDLMRAARR